MARKAAATEVAVFSSSCTGCWTCRLVCSFFTEREFNPSKAKLVVRRVDGMNRFMVAFLEDCTRCGICADYCPYGVLNKYKVEGGASQ